MENQTNNSMGNDMEIGIIKGCLGIRVSISWKSLLKGGAWKPAQHCDVD